MSAHVNPKVPVTLWLDREAHAEWEAAAQKLDTTVPELAYRILGHQIAQVGAKSSSRRLRPSEVKRMWAMLDAGVPQERVALALGTSRSTVTNRIRRARAEGHR